ncbi:MAG: DMT family transporter [archaeon]
MGQTLGILFAVIAMLGWGFGDFFIQKSVRKIGDMSSLFFITLAGAISLIPFVYQDMHFMFDSYFNFFLLFFGSAILFLAAVLDFEALKVGKLSVIEPLWSLEIVFASLLSFIVLGEVLESNQLVSILSLFIGLILVSLRNPDVFKKFFFERGVFIGILSASMMGTANFFMGWMARETDPLFAKWFFDCVLVILSLIIILKRKEFRLLKKEFMKNKKMVLSMCIFDNIAWTFYSMSMALIPISIATSFSESYIILAVLLGVYVNKEKLKKHQIVGLVIAIISAIYLAYSIG